MAKNDINKEMKVNKQNQSFGKMSARFSNRVKPKNIKMTIMRLIRHSKTEALIFSLVLILVIAMSMMNLYAPRVVGLVIDMLNEGDFKEGFYQSLLLLACLYLGVSFLTWFVEYLVIGASQRIIKSLREELFHKLSKLSISFFDTRSHGDIMSRFTNDIDQVSNVFSQSTTTLIRSVITVIGALIMMIYLNIYLSIGVLLSVPFVFGLSNLIAKKTIRYYKEHASYTGKINGQIEETVYGLSIVQTYNQEDGFERSFRKANEEVYFYGRKAQLWTGLLMPVLNVINNLTFAIIGLIGGYLVIKGHITVGVIASFMVYSRQFVRPLNELASIYNSLMSAIAGSERVFEILDQAEETEVKGLKDDFEIKGKIEFVNVNFAYNKGKDVLKNFSMEIKPGMKVAIVGPTGAGKTTIVNLITRFYAYQSGEIYIDDEPITNLNRHKLRQNIGFVLQDTYLFSGSIYANIQYGKLDASYEEIMAASKMAQAHSFISKLPNQYDTQLTYGGMNLSQGQRQLITIARAILLDPRVLILDEATSSVDIMTEQLISTSMMNLMKERTSLIIAHRLNTIISADLILVLKDGQVIEQGNHEELIKEDGFYKKMYQTT